MTTINIEEVPAFYQNYVKQVMHLEMHQALATTRKDMDTLIVSIPGEKENFAYGPGKWTVKEVLCHIIDAERIFVYRALCFSRNDRTNLPAFDENAYVPESNSGHRTLQSIRTEMNNLRASSIDFFNSCTEEMLALKGTANNNRMSVQVLGYVVAGHAAHHLNILKQRYL